MWICKSHYYSAGLNFYNFPYAFGGLFSLGLYAKYLEEGDAFLPKYRELLRATTVDTVENVAAIAGIDLTRPDFWRESLKTITDQIKSVVGIATNVKLVAPKSIPRSEGKAKRVKDLRRI